MLSRMLSPDTQAMLLLCGTLGQNRHSGPAPLTLGEYNELEIWLGENKMRPGDLLSNLGYGRLQQITGVNLNKERLYALLARGEMLALAVEKWRSERLWAIGRNDIRYPDRLTKRLKQLAPVIIYGSGKIPLLFEGGLAVVGSGEASQEESRYTEKLMRVCAKQEIQIVVGGTQGVGRDALVGIIDAGGTAVGVLAGSLADTYLCEKYDFGIGEGRLVLISPCDPDAGPTTNSAMERNKYIYGLADAALVVSSSFGRGETWAGAVGALEHIKDVPVFVRNSGNVPEGNRQLLAKGAKPFPEKLGKDLMQQLLDAAAAKPPAPDAEGSAIHLSETREDQGSQPSPKDIYEAVLPFILEQLQEPKDAKSLAECLDVRPAQLGDWLKRAVAEGRVVKTKKGYAVNGEGVQLPLEDTAE